MQVEKNIEKPDETKEREDYDKAAEVLSFLLIILSMRI